MFKTIENFGTLYSKGIFEDVLFGKWYNQVTTGGGSGSIICIKIEEIQIGGGEFFKAFEYKNCNTCIEVTFLQNSQGVERILLTSEPDVRTVIEMG